MIENDHVRPSKVKLPDLDEASGRPAELLLQGLDSGKQLFALRMPKGAIATSELELAFDLARSDTSAAKSCGEVGTRPGPEDRHLRLAFGATLGAPTSVVQEQGACNDAGGWNTVAAGDAWTVEALAGESEDDPNYVHVEVSVTPPAAVGTPSELGLALRWNRGGRVLQLPRVEGEEPDFADAATWETIRYTPLPGGVDIPLIAVDGQPVRRAN